MRLEYKIEDITNDEAQREQLIRFLATFEDENRGEEFWRKRLIHWWNTNPFYVEDMPKGWVLTYQGNTVGFLGAIAFQYVYCGEKYPALATTTWRVSTEHRKYSLRLLSEYHRLKDNYILLNTTPNEVAKKVFTAYRYQSIDEVHNYFFSIKQRSGLLTNTLFNTTYHFQSSFSKKNNLKIVKQGDIFGFDKQLFQPDQLQRNVTRDYITWYCQALSFEKEFVGAVQDHNNLSSYLILRRNRMKEIDTLQVIDYYSKQADNSEILALIQYVCENPETISISQGCKVLILSSFATNQLFERKPAYVLRRRSKYPQYYSTPSALNGVHKMCYIAEGDYGL